MFSFLFTYSFSFEKIVCIIHQLSVQCISIASSCVLPLSSHPLAAMRWKDKQVMSHNKTWIHFVIYCDWNSSLINTSGIFVISEEIFSTIIFACIFMWISHHIWYEANLIESKCARVRFCVLVWCLIFRPKTRGHANIFLQLKHFASHRLSDDFILVCILCATRTTIMRFFVCFWIWSRTHIHTTVATMTVTVVAHRRQFNQNVATLINEQQWWQCNFHCLFSPFLPFLCLRSKEEMEKVTKANDATNEKCKNLNK